MLILTASDIKAKAEKNRDGWKIHVAETDCDQALEIVKQYFRENPLSDPASIVSSAENPPSFLGLGAALVLLAFYVAAEVNAVHSVLIAEFGCSAEDVLRGQWYRTLTALMLHKDIVHLAGNMAAITVFTSAVTAATGSGIGSFMILLSGMAGNLLNAFFYKSNHFSIGASTA
ncbi:MAG: rhomboid family intramembrane serine protease, partial [Deltaproteobacteria bacterium]|nr:rhomboid family intramembrane serine protease [Deltaproteobacteria bacterium]